MSRRPSRHSPRKAPQTLPIAESRPRWPYVGSGRLDALPVQAIEQEVKDDWAGNVSGIYARPGEAGGIFDVFASLAEEKTRGRRRITIAGLRFHRQ